MKVKISSVLLILWYALLLVMVFIIPASGVLIIVTAIAEWLWKGPLKKNGPTWNIKR